MKTRDDTRKYSKIFRFNEEDKQKIEKASEKFNACEAEIVREALKDFYEKHGIWYLNGR